MKIRAAGRSWTVISKWRLVEAVAGGIAVSACTSYEVIGGPKRYLRKWDSRRAYEWGWTLHPSAQLIWKEEVPIEKP